MHSHHNGLKTAALLGLLTALILAVGYWLGGCGGLVFAVFLSLAMNAGTYFFSDKLALRAMRRSRSAEAEFPALYGSSGNWRPRPASRCRGCTSRRPCSRTRSRPGATRGTRRSP